MCAVIALKTARKSLATIRFNLHLVTVSHSIVGEGLCEHASNCVQAKWTANYVEIKVLLILFQSLVEAKHFLKEIF